MSQAVQKNTEQSHKSRQNWKKIGKIVSVSLAGALIFVTGWGIGSGRLTINSIKSVNGNLSSQLDSNKVNDVYRVLKQHYDGKLDQSALEEGMIRGMVEATNDPYTEFFNAKEAAEFNNQLSGGSITGIGAQLGKSDTGYIEVVAPIEGSPAARAGIQTKDIITEVDGDSTSGWGVEKAVSRIKGEKGTEVTLTIVRSNRTFEQKITREVITVPSVRYSMVEGSRVGLLEISQFSENTGSEARKAVASLKADGAESIILDLRNNPGGLVDQAVDVASMWLPRGKTILTEKRSDGKVIDTKYSSGSNPLLGIKTIVLVNEGSASASEIVAAALKDNGAAASIIGEKTYGKGVVQQIVNLSGGAQLKVTIATWFRPNGKTINKEGITPDKAVELTQEDGQAGNDTQKDAALEALR